jgi:hypothetical protein
LVSPVPAWREQVSQVLAPPRARWSALLVGLYAQQLVPVEATRASSVVIPEA